MGTLVLSARFPWVSSNDWRSATVSRLAKDGRTLEAMDCLGFGADWEPSWIVPPGLYFVEEGSWFEAPEDRAPRTGIWIEVLSERDSRVDFKAVRAASGTLPDR